MRFGFLVNEVLTGLRRNITMTVAMILTTAISLGLFGAGLLIVRLADHTRDMYLDRVSSQVFLTPELSASDPGCDGDVCKAIRQAIHDRPEFKGEVFVDSQEAGAEALKRNPQFKGLANETVFPSSFRVKLDDPTKHKSFDEALSAQPGVARVMNELTLLDRLFSVLGAISGVAFVISLVQAVGAVLLIANMVQVAAYTRRTEIGIMRLVGASRWYTQLPFLLEAVLAATVGVILAIVGLVVVRAAFLDRVLNQFSSLFARVDYLDILYISPILLAVGASMAALTAYVTLRLYVRR